MISRRGVVCVFFLKDMDDDDSLTDGRNVDGADNSTTALHAHLRERRLEMLRVRLPNREFGNIKNEAERRLAASRIAFCQILLPPCCGRLENGMFSPEWIQCGDDDLTPSPENADEDPYDVSGCLIARGRGEVEDIHRASFKGTQLDGGGWSLARLGGIPARDYEPVALKDLTLFTLREFARDHEWRFLLKVPLSPPEGVSDNQPAVLLYFGKASGKSPSAEHYPLDEHLRDVAKYATALAVRIGLPQRIESALELAGKFHDLGKQELIWQKAAGNLNNDGSLRAGTAVAKSI